MRTSGNRLAALIFVLFFNEGGTMAGPIPSEVKSVVAFVFLPGQNNAQPKPFGTAFFVGVKVPDTKDRYTVYLVSAKHVFRTPDNQAWLPKVLLRLNTKSGGSQFNEIPIVTGGKDKTVYVHPDETVDLAVIPMLPDDKFYEFKFLPEEFLTSQDDFKALEISEGSEVFFTGLFSPYVGTKRNYPLVRTGRVALITDERIKLGDREADLYLVDVSSYGGNSGSPVFFFLGSDRKPGSIILGEPILKLAGVMSGTFQDAQPIHVMEPTAKIAVSTSNMGVAGVVPAYKLRDILFGPELSTLREQLKEKGASSSK
jgi:hypothetical protein